MELNLTRYIFANMEGKTITVSHKATITKEEIDIVKMLADGLTLTQVAIKKKTTKSTLATNMSFLRGRIGCTNMANLVAYFLRNKLID